jgi:5-methyltetrahydrofolate--homocysteine methyltransferase
MAGRPGFVGTGGSGGTEGSMSETVISSKSAEVVIGFDRPFVVIGERINPTGRPQLAEEMRSGDFHRVEADALAQVAAGARVLDVNAGIPLADEPAILAGCVALLQSITDVPLCIDSSNLAALEAALGAYEGKALLNSVTGEDACLERVLPLVRKYGCAVVAISNDETGVSEDVEVRFAVARKIIERAMDYGIPPADVVVDPLVMPVGAMNTAGRQVIELVRRLRRELKVNTICGISNLSFGLPNRDGLNAAFISMAIGGGLTSAIANPLHAELMQAVRAADAIMGHDPQCAAWIRASRDPQGGVGSRTRRSGRRRNSGQG